VGLGSMWNRIEVERSDNLKYGMLAFAAAGLVVSPLLLCYGRIPTEFPRADLISWSVLNGFSAGALTRWTINAEMLPPAEDQGYGY